jgi:hypothetical protein
MCPEPGLSAALDKSRIPRCATAPTRYNRHRIAGVAELVDAADSKSAILTDMSVRVRPPAPALPHLRDTRREERALRNVSASGNWRWKMRDNRI